MPGFSVLSWNVGNFKLGKTDVDRVVLHIKGYHPDVFASLEVVGLNACDREA